MARLPTPMMVDSLRFTGNTRVEFTVKWASNDPFAGMIDHIYVRFLMTNLLSVGMGIDDAAMLAEMEGWTDLLVGPGAGPRHMVGAQPPPLPTSWDANLGTLHRIDYRSIAVPTPAVDKGGVADIHAEDYVVTDTAFQQRFVRLIAQARTAD